MLFIVAMEFSVGDSVEAVDQLGIWTKAKVVSKSDNAIVVNFHLLTKEKYLTYIKEVALFTIFGSMPACRQTHRNE